MKAVAVFCGSSYGHGDTYARNARNLGTELAARGIRLVYGGGNVGLMGVLADSTLAAGGEVFGVIPKALVDWEVAHRGLTELFVVDSMHERKARMAGLADGFLVLPGGFGTMEETMEVITWAQLGLHAKPLGFWNIEGFFDPLFSFFQGTIDAGFVSNHHLNLFFVESELPRLLERLDTFRVPQLGKYVPPHKPEI